MYRKLKERVLVREEAIASGERGRFIVEKSVNVVLVRRRPVVPKQILRKLPSNI
jgi:hypothetical protein